MTPRRRILFVDDEARVLDGLRRLLRDRRDQWDLAFATSAAEALALMAETPCDVVVSDMRMPGMDGATLLGEVAARWPVAIRLILTGHTEVEAAIRAVPVAHQFLMKPCDPAVLTAVIGGALALQERLLGQRFREVLGPADRLPPVPRVYAALGRELGRPDASVATIAAIIGQDPALVARLLQLVNSSFFGQRREVTSLVQAANLLGTSLLRSLVLSHEIFNFPPEDLGGLDLAVEQEHALRVATVARCLPKDPRTGEDSFTAGLLHDVGKLLLAGRMPEVAQRLRARATAERRPVDQVEREELGLSHADAGGYLLGLWGLPYPIVAAVAYHHTPERSEATDLDPTGAVHVANALVRAAATGQSPAACGLDLAWVASQELTDELPVWGARAADALKT